MVESPAASKLWW